MSEDKTYLRWVGGKMRWTSHLLPFVPRAFRASPSATYFEPFLGGASMFLAVQPVRAVLSDLNEALIRSFCHVRDDPGLVARYLRGHERSHCEEYYYQVRRSFNEACRYSAAQAARFIYLNRTCFNGVYRVNKNGAFNVPIGRRRRTTFPTASHLRSVSRALKGATLGVGHFEKMLREAREGDFVYLDPPYPPLNGTAFFRHYTPARFEEEDQEQLRDVVLELGARGVFAMVSNADVRLVRRLYKGMRLKKLRVTRFVASNGSRKAVGEVVVTNYDPHV